MGFRGAYRSCRNSPDRARDNPENLPAGERRGLEIWRQLNRLLGDSSLHWLAISQPLAIRRLNRLNDALPIRQIAAVVAELELGQVAVQVLLADRVINPVDPALHDGEVAFHRVGGHVTARVFLSRMVDGFMVTELAIKPDVASMFVRHDPSAAAYVLADRVL